MEEITQQRQDYRSTAKHALSCKRCERWAEQLMRELNPNERYALMCQIEWHERVSQRRRHDA
jgi:hypothetical protein